MCLVSLPEMTVKCKTLCKMFPGVLLLLALTLREKVMAISFTRHQILMVSADPSRTGMTTNQPEISWGTNSTHIDIELVYPSLGWIALGLSPNGGMDQADVLFAYVDDRTREVVVQDRFISVSSNMNVNLSLDAQQDWVRISGSQNRTHTIVRAVRKLETCDQADRPFTDATAPVIFSYNPSDPQSKTGPIRKHTQRGGVRINYLKTIILEKLPTERIVGTLNLTMGNIAIIPKSTLYYCRLMQLPAFDQKLHAVMITPVLDPRNVELLHHMDMFLCGDDLPDVSKENFECGLDSGVQTMKYCQNNMLAGWATGQERDILPPEAGQPFTPEMSGKYVVLQTHYNNPNMRGGIDNSGFSFSLTDQLRQFDTGGLLTGVLNVDYTFTLPPKQEAFQFTTQCTEKCTNSLPSEGILIINAIVHMHTRGRIGLIRHFRGDQELPPILQDMAYDYNYQTPVKISPARRFLPGDRLVTECTFSTKEDRQETIVFGGEGTTEEMCMGFMTYYPATSWTSCAAQYTLADYLNVIQMPENLILQSGLTTGPGETVSDALMTQDQDTLVAQLSNGVIPYVQNFISQDGSADNLQQFYKSNDYGVMCDASGTETFYMETNAPVVQPFQDQTTGYSNFRCSYPTSP